MVIGEQGLAALAFGKIEEVYEIEEIRQILDKRRVFSKVY